jgi:bis(5'-nucleosyl)-tetraphosphatase (symmetrical)
MVFGHWAALDGVTGRDDIVGIDTGCVWGRTLTAYDLKSGKKTSVKAF